MNVVFAGYNLGFGLVGLHGGPVPEDILRRPYFTNGLCGPGTGYSCPGPDVPIPRPSSRHMDHNGNLVD